jgi:hypothetical protein
MKHVRKPSRPSLEGAMEIVESGIEKIVAEITRNRGNSDGKPGRPRSPKAKASSRRAA